MISLAATRVAVTASRLVPTRIKSCPVGFMCSVPYHSSFGGSLVEPHWTDKNQRHRGVAGGHTANPCWIQNLPCAAWPHSQDAPAKRGAHGPACLAGVAMEEEHLANWRAVHQAGVGSAPHLYLQRRVLWGPGFSSAPQWIWSQIHPRGRVCL